MAANALVTPQHIISRVAASLLGGYAFMWGFVTLVITLSVALGLSYHDGFHLAMLLAFLVFLTLFCWTFAAASLKRVWAVLISGGAIMTGAAWLMQNALIA